MEWCTGDTDSLDPHETSLECDYDKSVTNLYDAIEKRNWNSVMTFLDTKRWSVLSLATDILTPDSQTRTWVTRFDHTGKIRWSQLPIHAAIIFKAPLKVVKGLIDSYPLSVRCTDDQGMLPLHLAFRVGAKDEIVNILIRCFPDGLLAKNQYGRLPYTIDGREVRKDFSQTIQQVVKHTARQVSSTQRKVTREKTDDLEDTMEQQKERVNELEHEKEDLEHKLAKAKTEIAVLRERCRMFEKMNGEAKPIDKKYNQKVPCDHGPKHGSKHRRKQPKALSKDTILEKSKKILELVSSFTQDDDILTSDGSTSDESFLELDNYTHPRVRSGSVLADTLGNSSVASSVRLNPIKRSKKKDVQWKDYRKKPDSSDDIVSRYERREVDPVAAEREKYLREAGVCWDEVRQSISCDMAELRRESETEKKKTIVNVAIGEKARSKSASRARESVSTENERSKAVAEPKNVTPAKESRSPSVDLRNRARADLRSRLKARQKEEMELKQAIEAARMNVASKLELKPALKSAQKYSQNQAETRESPMSVRDTTPQRDRRKSAEKPLRKAVETRDTPIRLSNLTSIRERRKAAEQTLHSVRDGMKKRDAALKVVNISPKGTPDLIASSKKRHPDRNRWENLKDKNSKLQKDEEGVYLI